MGIVGCASGLAQAAQCTEKIFVGDFNGDGLADVMRWRDSDKKWVVYLSTGDNFATQTWGGAWGSDGLIFVGDPTATASPTCSCGVTAIKPGA